MEMSQLILDSVVWVRDTCEALLEGVAIHIEMFSVSKWLDAIVRFGLRVYRFVKAWFYARSPKICSTYIERFLGLSCALETTEDFQTLKQYEDFEYNEVSNQVTDALYGEATSIPMANCPRKQWDISEGGTDDREGEALESPSDSDTESNSGSSIGWSTRAIVKKSAQTTYDRARLRAPLAEIPTMDIEDCLMVDTPVNDYSSKELSGRINFIEHEKVKLEEKIARTKERNDKLRVMAAKEGVKVQGDDERKEKRVKGEEVLPTIGIVNPLMFPDEDAALHQSVTVGILEARAKSRKTVRKGKLPELRKALVEEAKSTFSPTGGLSLDLLTAKREIVKLCSKHNICKALSTLFAKELPAFVVTPDAAEIHAAYIVGSREASLARFKRDNVLPY